MAYLVYGLPCGGYVNRLLLSGVFVEESPFPKTTLRGEVNEWLVKGPEIYDNPGRAEVTAKRKDTLPPYLDMDGMLPGGEIAVSGQTQKLEAYFPFESDRVSCSGFYETPAWLRCYGCTVLEAEKEEEAPFELSTCGAVTVWVNGKLTADFAPLSRNVERKMEAAIPLEQGENRLVVCMEELAERDTDYYFTLRYLGEQELLMKVPVGEEVDEEAVGRAEKALSAMYFEKEAYLDEDVVLKLESFLDVPVEAILASDKFRQLRHYTLLPGHKELILLRADEIPSGFSFFRLEVLVCGLSIRKVIGTYSLNTEYMGYHEEDYGERKQRVWDIVRNLADEGNDYRLLLRLAEGEAPDNLEEAFRVHLGWVLPKRDCSDFRMVILVYLYVRFSHRLPFGLRMKIEDAMLGYRYWIDEPGDDVMWFFSENHALMFHFCQYFAGKAMPERIFTASGLTGREAAGKAEGLLNQWFERFFAEFATEWNSSTYLPIDVMGLAYLYDLEPKESALHQKAKQALDMLAFCLAVNEHKGNFMVSFGRTYEKELKGSYSTGMPSLLYLFYNAGYLNSHFRALIPVILGDYEPPEEYAKYVRLSGEEELIHQNTQGIGQFVNLYLYKNSKALLSTAVNCHPGIQGYQETVLQATLDGTAQVFINHPAQAEVYGTGRPGFWVGNGSLPFATQYRNLAIACFHIGEECRLHYTHAYVPVGEFEHWKLSEKAAALEKDGGFIGIRALNGLSMQGDGPCRNRELISAGRDNVWVVKVGRFEEYQDVGQLLREMEQMDVVLQEDGAVRVTDGETCYLIEENILYVDGKKVHSYPLDVKGQIELTGGRWKNHGH